MSATIAARAHSSASLSAPVKRAKPAANRSRKLSWLARVLRAVAHRPGRALLMLLFSGIALAILLNAMLFQKARHPAPIAQPAAVTAPARHVEQRRAEPAPVQAAAPAADATAPMPGAPLPPTRPNALSQAAREAQPRPPAGVTAIPRTAPVQAAAPAPTAARTAPTRDPIADLINGDLRPPADIRGAAARPAARRTAEN